MGNPPWVSRKKDNVASAKNWCSSLPLRNLLCRLEKLAWAFIWKGLEHIKRNGIVGFCCLQWGFPESQGQLSKQEIHGLKEHA